MQDNSKVKESQRHVEVLIKGLEILDYVEQYQPVSLSNLAKNMNINKSRIIRLCGTFEHLGYLIRDANKLYSLGHRLLSLGHAYEKNSPMVRIIRPFLEKLNCATNLSAAFYVLSGQVIVCFARVGSNMNLNSEIIDSNTRELYFGASGKIFLAFGPQNLRDNYFSQAGRTYPQLTPHTIISPDILWGKLNQIKKDGYCISLEERIIGAGGIGAPVFNGQGELAGVVTLSGNVDIFSDNNLKKLVPQILQETKEISCQLPY